MYKAITLIVSYYEKLIVAVNLNHSVSFLDCGLNTISHGRCFCYQDQGLLHSTSTYHDEASLPATHNKSCCCTCWRFGLIKVNFDGSPYWLPPPAERGGLMMAMSLRWGRWVIGGVEVRNFHYARLRLKWRKVSAGFGVLFWKTKVLRDFQILPKSMAPKKCGKSDYKIMNPVLLVEKREIKRMESLVANDVQQLNPKLSLP